MATLHVHLPGSGIVSHELSGKDVFSIGSAPESAIQLQDSSVSPRHAEILCEGGCFRLRDLGSANKCWLNGVAVTEAAIHDGDLLRFGTVESVFLVQGGATAVETTLRGRLVMSIPGHGETVFRFEGPMATIGWKSDNDVRIQDPSISGHHAQFIQAKGQYRLKDLDSTNKTVVNGHTIVEEEVHNGDAVQFGAVSGIFKVEYGIRPVSAPSPAPADPAAAAAAEALAAQVAQWKAKHEALTKEQESLHFHNQQLSTQLKDASAQAEKLQAALESTATQAQEKLAELTEERDALQAREKAQAQVLGAAQKEAESLSGELAQARTRLDVLAKERENVGKTGDELSQRLAKSESALATLQSERPVLEGKLAATVVERDALQTTATEAQESLKALTLERDALQATSARAQGKLAALTQERDALQARTETDAQTLGAARKEAESLSGELAQARTRLDALAKERENAGKTGDELSRRLAESESALATLRSERPVLEGKLTILTAERDALQTTAAETQGKLAALTKERDALQTMVAEAQGKLAALTQERDALQTTATEAQGKVAALTKERDALQTTTTEAQGKLTVLTQERSALQAKATEAEGKLTALTQERSALQAKATEAEGKLTALTQERSALQAKATEAEGKLTALTQERSALQAKATEAEGKLTALTQERSALQAKATEAEGKLTALTQERAVLQTAATEAQQQIQRLVEQKAASTPAAPVSAAPASALPRPLSLLREEIVPPAPVEGPKTGLIEINTPGSSMARFASRLPQDAAGCDADSPSIQKIVENAPEALNGMRRCLHAFIKSQAEISLLQQLLTELHELTEQTVQANLTSVATFSFALERLIDDLMKIPGQINPSSLRTVSQSIDFLVTLLDGKNLFRTKQPDQANIFAVDDDADACKTIRGAIEMVNLKVVCAGDAKATLAALNERQFDLVLIDVGLPEMNGFELCTRLRKLENYKKVPVVFITGAVTVQNRVQSSLSGGNDFIAKPFNLLELGVKTLIWIFKGQLGMV